MLQVFEFCSPQNVVMAHDGCDLVIALAARRGAQQLVKPALSFHAERADVYSNPRNNGDGQIAPCCSLLVVERKEHGPTSCVVERFEKGGGGGAHAPSRIRIH